jgi:hypothetical protein
LDEKLRSVQGPLGPQRCPAQQAELQRAARELATAVDGKTTDFDCVASLDTPNEYYRHGGDSVVPAPKQGGLVTAYVPRYRSEKARTHFASVTDAIARTTDSSVHAAKVVASESVEV